MENEKTSFVDKASGVFLRRNGDFVINTIGTLKNAERSALFEGRDEKTTEKGKTAANLNAGPNGPLDASRRKFIMNGIIRENEMKRRRDPRSLKDGGSREIALLC